MRKELVLLREYAYKERETESTGERRLNFVAFNDEKIHGQ